MDRLTPPWLTVVSVLGLLAGALAGWLLTGWVSRRTGFARGTIRSLTREPAVLGLLLLLPQALLGFTGLVFTAVSSEPPGKPFWAISLTYGFGCGLLGFVFFAVSLITALVAGRRNPSPDGALEVSS